MNSLLFSSSYAVKPMMQRCSKTGLRFLMTTSSSSSFRPPPSSTKLAEHHHHHQVRRRSSIEILIDPKAMSSKQIKQKRQKKKRPQKSSHHVFVDRTRICASGGRGGKGSLSMHPIGRKHKLRPDGGHGGHGGSVVLVADHQQQSSSLQYLTRHSSHVVAENGSNGDAQAKHGKNGKNLILRVPCGVVVKRILDYDEIWDDKSRTVLVRKQQQVQDGEFASSDKGFHEDVEEDSDSFENDDLDNDDDLFSSGQDAAPLDREAVVLADLDEPGAHVMVARGGSGGYGTQVHASEHGPLPDASVLIQNAKPQPGEVAFLELELKMIADLGLVGLPNAGKSSLLCAMSRASPEVAPYPFTTLNPIVGCIDYKDGFRIRAADIPGLISGASKGRGRGHDFLRHVERTKALLYIVDVAGVDFRDPVEDLRVLANELDSYGDGSLLERRALLVANKVDLLPREQVTEVLSAIEEAASEIGIHYEHHVMGISAGVTGEGLSALSKAIRDVVSRSTRTRAQCTSEAM